MLVKTDNFLIFLELFKLVVTKMTEISCLIFYYLLEEIISQKIQINFLK